MDVENIQGIFATLHAADFSSEWLRKDLSVANKGFFGNMFRWLGLGKLGLFKKHLYGIDLTRSFANLEELVHHYLENDGSLDPEHYPPLNIVTEVLDKCNRLIEHVNAGRSEGAQLDLHIDSEEVALKASICEHQNAYHSHVAYIQEQLPSYETFEDLHASLQAMCDWKKPQTPSLEAEKRTITQWRRAITEKIAENQTKLEQLDEEMHERLTKTLLSEVNALQSSAEDLLQRGDWKYSRDLKTKLLKRIEELELLKRSLPKKKYAAEYPTFKARWEELKASCTEYLKGIETTLQERAAELSALEEATRSTHSKLVNARHDLSGQRRFHSLRAEISRLLPLVQAPAALEPGQGFEVWVQERYSELKKANEAFAMHETNKTALLQEDEEWCTLLKETAVAMQVQLPSHDSRRELAIDLEETSNTKGDWVSEALLQMAVASSLEDATVLARGSISLWEKTQSLQKELGIIAAVEPTAQTPHHLTSFNELFNNTEHVLYSVFADTHKTVEQKLSHSLAAIRDLRLFLTSRYQVIIEGLMGAKKVDDQSLNAIFSPLRGKVEEHLSELESKLVAEKETATNKAPLEELISALQEQKSSLQSSVHIDKQGFEVIHATMTRAEQVLDSN